MRTSDGKEVVYRRGRWVLVSKDKGPAKHRRAFVMDPELISNLMAFWEQKGGVYIPYEVMSSKNSKEFIYVKGEPRLVHSKAYAKYSKITHEYYHQQRSLYKKIWRDLPLPHSLWIYHIRASKRRWDYHNMMQGPADLMVQHGWMEDDDHTRMKLFPGDYFVEKNYQGVVIFPEEKPCFQELIYEMRSLVVVP